MVPGNRTAGRLRAGHVRILDVAVARYGTLRLRDVLEPAIAYARDGYPMVERRRRPIATVGNVPQHWPTSRRCIAEQRVPKPGTLFTNKKLSRNLYAGFLQEAESAGADRRGADPSAPPQERGRMSCVRRRRSSAF